MPVDWIQQQLPSITLTNERNEDDTPSPALSPLSPQSVKDVFSTPYTSVNQNAAKDTNAWRSTQSIPGINRAANDISVRVAMTDNRFSPSKLRKVARSNVVGSTAAPTMSTAATLTTSISDVARDARAIEEHHQQQQQHTAIDPLSSQIIKRTSASPLAVAPLSVRRSSSETTSMRADDARSTRSRSRSGQRPDNSENARDDLKKGVKAVAFLSRLIGSNHKKKDSPDQAFDAVSITSDAQIEGNEAEVFAQAPGTTGFSLRSTQPPSYIKVRSRYKERREFDHLFLAQELRCSKRRKLVRTDSNKLLRRKSSATSDADTVWAMQFSRDGMHLAAGGADAVVRVWKVLSSLEDRKAHESNETNADEHLSAPVFNSQAVREYVGHEAPVLDLSWSKNNFLISSSMDKTVRLWHLSRAECLCTFRHNDFVPSIAFHPRDDRFFLAGSLDSKLRLWNISEKAVAFSVEVPDMITAVAFMPDGKSAVAGTRNGSCYWYETEGFKYKTQLQIKPDKGTGISGPKITAIQAAQGRGGDKVLVTSNDSKIRLYNIRDKGCEMVFKGNVNDSSQIKGTLSDDGRYVVCGSEDRKAYIWSVTPTETGKLDKKPVEFFDAHDSITTSVCIAPAKTRRLLAQSEDPIYDLSSTFSALARTESHGSSKPPTELLTETETQSMLNRSNSTIARAGYRDGNIVVTADYAGKIKVFRQDCAWQRRQMDDTDRASIFKRERSSLASSSLQTRSSQRSLREAKNAAMAQVASSDRIMTWRQGINNQARPKSQSRECSPNDPTSRASDSNEPSSGSPSTIPTSTDSAERPATVAIDSAASDNCTKHHERSASEDALFLEGQRSYMYWNQNAAVEDYTRARKMFNESATQAEQNTKDGAMLGPGLQHRISYVSQLSDEHLAQEIEESEDDHFDDAEEEQSGG